MTLDLKSAMESANTSEFLKAEAKIDVADRQIPMLITKVEPKVDTQYGDQVMYYVISKEWGRDENGEPVSKILAFTHSTYREDKARAIKKAMDAAPGQLAGPVYLGRYQTRNGHNAWELYAEPQQTKTANSIPTPAPATSEPAAASTGFDSDIPF